MSQKSIFREKVLANKSSQERLDERIKIVSVPFWGGMLAVLFLILVAGIWGWFGRIDSKVNGVGIIMNVEDIRSVSSQASGIVKYINVLKGTYVQQNEVLGVIDQPVLELEIKQLTNKLAVLETQFNVILQAEEKESIIKKDYFKKMSETTDLTLEKLYKIQGYLKELSPMYQELREKAVSKTDFYQILQSSINAEVNVSAQNANKYKIPVEEFDSVTSKNRRIWEKLREIRLVQNELEVKRIDYVAKTLLYSPIPGIVTNVMKNPGDSVIQGENVFVIIPTSSDSMELTAYVSIKDWKRVSLNQLVYISPTVLPAQRYGYMVGLVKYIGDYPDTDQNLESTFKNKGLVKFIKAGESVVIPIKVEPIPDPTNWTGVRWTSSTPPEKMITLLGMPCSIMIVVERRQPISYVIPWMKETLFGIGTNLKLNKTTQKANSTSL